MRIAVSGGCGYVGSVLVPKLLANGHTVRVLDIQWFGINLEPHPKLEIVKGDLRERREWCEGMNAVIHLAGIANDPCGDLDAKLTWEVNVLATLWLAQEAMRARCLRFIYASSASVYGIHDNKPVTEDSSLEPVSDYNKTKMVAERVLMSFKDLHLTIIRPATVCGVSPRMRSDVIVNMLTLQALERGKITAHCGAHGRELMRPHIHIEDMTDLYVTAVERPLPAGVFNAGFENLSVGNLAHRIAERIHCEVEFTEVQDKRSYAVDSSRLLALGFKPRWTVREAVNEIASRCLDLRQMGCSQNLAHMKRLGIAT